MTSARRQEKAVVALLILLAVQNALADSALLNYEHRVVRAAEQIERIKADSDYSREGVTYIKRLLPKAEEVQFDGRPVQVDNNWLWVLLDSYQQATDPNDRAAKLNEIGGRLRALDQQLQRSEAGSEARSQSGNDRPAERQRLEEILSRSEYQPPQETAVSKYIKLGLAKVREVLGKIRDAFQSLLEAVFGAGASGGVISKILVIVTIVIALVIAVRMVGRIKPVRKRARKRIVLGEEVEADATPRDLADAATAAANSGDFRMAIRKLYVSLLYELAERRLIELEDSATNHEYLAKVSSHRTLVPPMRFLTDRFDYIWYGMYPSSAEEFSDCLARYREAVQGAAALSEQRAGG
jgi:hypothetical protein